MFRCRILFGLCLVVLWVVIWGFGLYFFHPRPHLPPATMGAVPLETFMNQSLLTKNHEATTNKSHRRGEF